MSGPAGEPTRATEFTDGLAHLAAALQRLDMTMSGIERLPVPVIHALAEILNTVPAKNRHQHLPPEPGI
jgi:hypothetical protein